MAFYDIFDYPLTALELYRNLETVAEFGELIRVLEILKNENKIKEESGFFYLPEKIFSVDKRKTRFLISSKKMKRAKRIAKVLSFFPWIRFIGVCNSLGFFNAEHESDIDFFVIAKKKRMWLARFFAASLLQIFGLRPQGENAKDKICLSFFIDENGLDISSVALPGGDPYFARWTSWILPLYDDGIYKEFIEKNCWIKNILPNFREQSADLKSRKFFLPDFFEYFSNDWVDDFSKKIQLRIMPTQLKDAAERGDGSVILGDRMIKLHLLDRRAEYKNNYELRIKNYE